MRGYSHMGGIFELKKQKHSIHSSNQPVRIKIPLNGGQVECKIRSLKIDWE